MCADCFLVTRPRLRSEAHRQLVRHVNGKRLARNYTARERVAGLKLVLGKKDCQEGLPHAGALSDAKKLLDVEEAQKLVAGTRSVPNYCLYDLACHPWRSFDV